MGYDPAQLFDAVCVVIVPHVWICGNRGWVRVIVNLTYVWVMGRGNEYVWVREMGFYFLAPFKPTARDGLWVG